MTEQAKPARQMPDEIVAWPADLTPQGETALTGSWGARRHYTDEAGKYVSGTRFEQVEAAAKLGLEMAKANGLWNTAEEIEQALKSAHSKYPPHPTNKRMAPQNLSR